MNEYASLLREFGSFGVIMAMVGFSFYMIVTRIAPAFERLSKAIDANTAQSKETHEFMKKLNGKLVDTVKTKLK